MDAHPYMLELLQLLLLCCAAVLHGGNRARLGPAKSKMQHVAVQDAACCSPRCNMLQSKMQHVAVQNATLDAPCISVGIRLLTHLVTAQASDIWFLRFALDPAQTLVAVGNKVRGEEGG